MDNIDFKYDISVFSKNIKHLRLRSGKTQKEIAKELNISSSRWSNWEQGSNLPSLPQLLQICEHFRITMDFLFDSSIRKFITTGMKLKQLRTDVGMTQREFGFLFGLQEETIRKWESDKIDLSASHIHKICRFYDITPNELLGYDEPIKTEGENE